MSSKIGIIFDLDGVIVDTAHFHYLAWRKLANRMGFDISLHQNEQLKGVSRARSLESILSWGNKQVSATEFDALMAGKNEEYLASISNMSEKDLLPGVGPVLDYLKEKNIPFALGSASKNSRLILKSLKIYDSFSAIVDGNDVTKAKPDPEVFLIAARKLKLDPKDCIVLEDAQAGIEAARAAGMSSVGIGDATVLKDADYNFGDFREITIEVLQGISESNDKTAFIPAFLHIEFPSEVPDHFICIQVQRLLINVHIDPNPVRRIEHLRKGFRVTVLPPAHLCLVRIINSCYITALKCLPRILFLKIGALPHGTVAKTEEAF